MACDNLWLRLVRAQNSNGLGYDYLSPTPCGYCRGCVKDYIDAWTDRCTFESMTTRGPSAFVTLTYNDDYLPKNGSVSLRDMQNFWKRFRYYLHRLDPTRKVKFYYASEYGFEDFRPHYHFMIFNFDPKNQLDMSVLYRAWSSKKNPIGFFSADYLNSSRVRYTMKYVHEEFNPDFTNDIEKRGLAPLFHNCSKGLGFDWFMQNLGHIIKNRGYIVNGKVRPLNRYYQDLFKLIEPKSPYVSIHKNVETAKSLGFDFNASKLYNINEYTQKFARPIRERHLAYEEYFYGL